MNLEAVFNQILKPTLGCTEPVAIALAVGSAVQAAAGWTPDREELPAGPICEADVKALAVRVNKNIFKNCFSIYIPNSEGHKGIIMAAAMGLFADPRNLLEVFKDLDTTNLKDAEQLVKSGKIEIEIVDAPTTDLYIEAIVRYMARGKEKNGLCRIQDQHTNICLLKQGEQELFLKESCGQKKAEMSEDLKELMSLQLGQLVDLVDDLPESVILLIRRTIQMNSNASDAGLTEPMGLGAGYYEATGEEETDRYLSGIAAAGSDARMSGYCVEVMSSAGSGNQGIIATMPIVAYARQKGLSEQELIRAVALSHLITMYITLYVGYLSALCGVAVKAGVGAACGIVLAMGGGRDEIVRAVKIMAASLSGMVCDGAKPGCALKVGSSADMAVRAANLAMRKMEVSDDNGIVASTAEKTIQNLAEISHSMEPVDSKIIQIMNEKIRSSLEGQDRDERG